jgi:beta-barrel assembly-enhancing protease
MGSIHEALARIDPGLMAADVAPGFKPADTDERGLWAQVDQMEQDVRKSNAIIRDPALNRYMTDLVCRLAGDFCPDVRVYILRTPYFNASMYPTGMMHVWSGLLLRMRSEAQLAAVLGHEIGHYLRRHSIKRWRDVRNKSSIMSLVGLPLAIASAGASYAVMMAMQGSIAVNSRDDEREADAFGLRLMDRSGLELNAASAVWQQLIDERDASARSRGKKKARDDFSFFASSHPQSAERMADLAASAKALRRADAKYSDRRADYLAALGTHRRDFLLDQIKLNDFGGTDYLVHALAADGWTGELKFALGEIHRQRGGPDDFAKAAGLYREAVALPDVPPEAWRGLGYTLIKLGDAPAGKEALARYLAAKPEAADAAMVKYMLQ